MILLDTHVVLWWATGDDRISVRAQREIARADSLLVSPVTCWEIATLVRKSRLRLDRDVYLWIADLYEEEAIESVPVSVEAALSAGLLPADTFPGDPADRFLYATAREMVVPFVTKDVRIREYARSAGDIRTIW